MKNIISCIKLNLYKRRIEIFVYPILLLIAGTAFQTFMLFEGETFIFEKDLYYINTANFFFFIGLLIWMAVSSNNHYDEALHYYPYTRRERVVGRMISDHIQMVLFMILSIPFYFINGYIIKYVMESGKITTNGPVSTEKLISAGQLLFGVVDMLLIFLMFYGVISLLTALASKFLMRHLLIGLWIIFGICVFEYVVHIFDSFLFIFLRKIIFRSNIASSTWRIIVLCIWFITLLISIIIAFRNNYEKKYNRVVLVSNFAAICLALFISYLFVIYTFDDNGREQSLINKNKSDLELAVKEYNRADIIKTASVPINRADFTRLKPDNRFFAINDETILYDINSPLSFAVIFSPSLPIQVISAEKARSLDIEFDENCIKNNELVYIACQRDLGIPEDALYQYFMDNFNDKLFESDRSRREREIGIFDFCHTIIPETTFVVNNFYGSFSYPIASFSNGLFILVICPDEEYENLIDMDQLFEMDLILPLVPSNNYLENVLDDLVGEDSDDE